ncbi:MAG TPA: hypothetical protein VMW46_03240 [Candidatus Desulfaltia sp.]|nr:hypothetical protein [Candidatus Desulfaltia sp.]
MNPEELNPEDIKLLATFIHSLAEGKQDQEPVEAWNIWDRFLKIEIVIAKRLDYRDRTHELLSECRAWLQRGKEDLLQYTDEQLVDVTGSHCYHWLRDIWKRPYPPVIVFETMLPSEADGEPRRIDEMEDVSQETPEQALIIKQETKPESKRGRPPEITK